MLSNQSILNPAERLREAQEQYARLSVRAESGDTEAASQLQGASSTYLDAAASYYGQSSSQYAAIFGDVTDGVQDLERQFGRSIDTLGSIESIEQRALREQERARELLMGSLSEEVRQSDLLGSIADLIDLLPSSLASAIESILPEFADNSGGGAGATGWDTAAYLANKTNQVNSIEYQGRDSWTEQQVLDAIIRDYGSVEAHYAQIGRSEGVKPYYESQFANGGAFTNGIVTRPTAFPLGLMGEAGEEAIMPLTNIGGKLGVRAELPMPVLRPTPTSNNPTVNLEPLTRELAALRQEVAQLRSERRSDAEQAALQRSAHVREQQKINRNTKTRVPTL